MTDAAARTDRPEVVLDPLAQAHPPVTDPDRHADLFNPRIEHRVRLIDRGPFAVAVCSACGWESFARRSRGLARSEGRDHERLQSTG